MSLVWVVSSVDHDNDGRNEYEINDVCTSMTAANASAENVFAMMTTTGDYNRFSSEPAGHSPYDRTGHRFGRLPGNQGHVQVKVVQMTLTGDFDNAAQQTAVNAASGGKKAKTTKASAKKSAVTVTIDKSAPKKRKSSSPVPAPNGDADAADDQQVIAYPTPTGASNALSGYSFLVTGTLDCWTRPQVQTLIEQHGGTVEKAFKDNLSYVVLGSKPGQKKLEEIAKTSVTTIDQDELWEMIGTEGDGDDLDPIEVERICKPPKAKKQKKAA